MHVIGERRRPLRSCDRHLPHPSV